MRPPDLEALRYVVCPASYDAPIGNHTKYDKPRTSTPLSTDRRKISQQRQIVGRKMYEKTLSESTEILQAIHPNVVVPTEDHKQVDTNQSNNDNTDPDWLTVVNTRRKSTITTAGNIARYSTAFTETDRPRPTWHQHIITKDNENDKRRQSRFPPVPPGEQGGDAVMHD